jgi:DNA end-binding protein Ku
MSPSIVRFSAERRVAPREASGTIHARPRGMRALWTGEIAFGLVAVPVKLYSATKNLAPKFHLLHKKDGGRIQFKRFCSKEDVEVPWDEIGKGYEVSKGRYALFSKEELEDLEEEEAAQGIDIVEFIDPGEVDLAYIEKSYWVGPAGKTTRSYELLRQALEQSGKVALARVKIRTRTRLALLRPRDGRFALDMMRYGDELVDGKEVEVPKAKTSPKELDLALDLVERMTGAFDPAKHPDQYRSAVLHAVERKEKADDLEEDEGARPTRGRGQVVDLAEILARSLAGSKKGRPVQKRAPAAAAREARSKRSGKARPKAAKGGRTSTKRKAARRR